MCNNEKLHNLIVSRRSSTPDTIISIGNGDSKINVGGKNFTLIAGPCTIESEDMICRIAEAVKYCRGTILRGGAFKPRTSPYDFQGHGKLGLKWLSKAKALTGLPTVSEITSIEHLPYFEDVDILQVGSRNMQNYELLKALGKVDKPILLKRGLSSSLTDLIMSAEYIASNGNPNIILCERGIRSFNAETRNTFDLAAIPLLQKATHLPVIADPSHATGRSDLIEPMSLAAVASGASGLMIEVHDNPQVALCDGCQSITPTQLNEIAEKSSKLIGAIR